MFKFDLTSMPKPSCQSMPLKHDYEAIKYPSMLTTPSCRSISYQQVEDLHQEQSKVLYYEATGELFDGIQEVKRSIPPSPARTASTQFSSICSSNNKSFGMDLSRDSIDPESVSCSSSSSDGIKVEHESSDINGKGTIDVKRSNSFTKLLKSLRKNVSLVGSTSFDSGKSKRSRKEKRNSVSTLTSVEVDVRVVEGEGVEVSTRESDDSTSCESDCTESDQFSVPKIIRDTSTFATTPLTREEESSKIEIKKDNAETRRLRNLIVEICSSEDEDDIELIDSDYSLNRSVEIFSCHHQNEEYSESIEVLSVSEVSEPNGVDAFVDLMIFVNNEQRVLEYAPEELQQLD